MSSTPVGAPLRSGNWPPGPHLWTEAELAQLGQPLNLLQDPAPHSKLGQQVRRLEQHGLHKAAKAVKVCGRLGETWTYACGRFIRKIVRAHLRFCCAWCDRAINTRLFDEHRDYRKRLHPAATLHRVTVRSRHWPLTIPRIRDLEDSVVEAIRQWLKGYCGWGFKSLTHYGRKPECCNCILRSATPSSVRATSTLRAMIAGRASAAVICAVFMAMR
jgi:hypothetical protein